MVSFLCNWKLEPTGIHPDIGLGVGEEDSSFLSHCPKVKSR